jgi:hypothetical protein
MQKLILAAMAFSFAVIAKANTDPIQDRDIVTDEMMEAEGFIDLKQTAFKPGEKLVYRLTYGVWDAGEATLSVLPTQRTVKGRKLWRVRGVGKTISAFEWFYKVDDVYESYIDQKALVPWVFKRRVDEGGFKINQDYTFFQHKNKVKNEKGKEFDVPNKVQDMISAFYYARTIDFSKAKVNDLFEVDIFLDDELFPTKIKYLGKEVIKTRKGKFSCHKFSPLVEQGRVFNSDDALVAYITDDGYKIPIMVKAKIQIGTIKMHLVKWDGLANPMSYVN